MLLGQGVGPGWSKIRQELLHRIRSIEVSVACFRDQDQHGPSSHQKPRALLPHMVTNSYKFSCGKCHLQTSVVMSSSDKMQCLLPPVTIPKKGHVRKFYCIYMYIPMTFQHFKIVFNPILAPNREFAKAGGLCHNSFFSDPLGTW